MKRFVPLLLVIATLSSVAPAWAQSNHADVVANVKNEMGAAAFTSADAMLGFVMRVIEHLPPEDRVGLVSAPQGAENVAFYGQGHAWVRVNRIIYPNGQIIKILGDSGASPLSGNTPQWNFDDVRPDLYVPFFASAPPVIQPPPVVQPPPAPPPVQTSNAELIALIEKSIDKILDGQQQALTVAKDTNVRVANLDRTIGQTLGAFSKFAGKYIAPAVLTWYLTHSAMKDNSAQVTP